VPLPFQDEIEAFERRDLLHPPPPGAVVFYGSSTFRLWPGLESAFPGRRIVNRGFGGSQIEDCIRYAPRIVIPLRPASILFYAGDNDLAAGMTPEQVLGDYRRLVALLRAESPGVRIVFVSIKPSPSRTALLGAMRQANALVRDWSRQDPRLDFVDVFTPMLDSEGMPRPELFGPDALHMNAAGYALWTPLLAPVLRPSPPPG